MYVVRTGGRVGEYSPTLTCTQVYSVIGHRGTYGNVVERDIKKNTSRFTISFRFPRGKVGNKIVGIFMEKKKKRIKFMPIHTKFLKHPPA